VNLLGSAGENVRIATALHEAGHAIAYLSIGRDFEYLSVDESQIIGDGKPIDAWNRAVTSMAGPAVESIMHHNGHGTDADIYGWIIDQIQERREFAAVEDCDEPNDYTDAGAYAANAVPLALAVVTSHWEDVERIAIAALKVPRLAFDDVVALTTGGDQLGNELSRWNACSKP